MTLTLIDWQEDFKVGVADVDHDHRQMIDLINALYANMQKSRDTGAALEFLGEIYARIQAHFALEEKIMREREYDQLAEHKADHERLLDELLDMMNTYEDEVGLDDERLAHQLHAWFTNHFKTLDARLHKRLGH